MATNALSTHEPLSDSEWDVMKIVWKIEPAPAGQIAEYFPQWHPKTVRTMLLRLHKKGVVNHQLQAGIQHFSALISREDCERKATQSFMQRVFDGALSPMVAHFTKQKSLSEEDRKALLKLLEETKKGK